MCGRGGANVSVLKSVIFHLVQHKCCLAALCLPACSADLNQRSWISKLLFFCLFTSTYWTPPCHLMVNSTFLWMFNLWPWERKNHFLICNLNSIIFSCCLFYEAILLSFPHVAPPSLPDGGDSGLDDKDMEASIATVRSLCEQIDADLIWLRERTDTGGTIQDYLIRQRVGEQDFLEVRWSNAAAYVHVMLLLTVVARLILCPCLSSGLQGGCGGQRGCWEEHFAGSSDARRAG